MLDRLVYSIAWLAGLLWLTSWVFHHEGTGWDIAYGFLAVMVLVQLGLICYRFSDWRSRRRMWHRLRGTPPLMCPHGASWDDCPDCRH